MTRQAPRVTFGVLGPVLAATDDGPLPVRGARQRAVLARLLIARGRVVPVDRLAGALWAEPADGAVAAIRTFVSDLRRTLEPDRPPRQPAKLLVTTPPGYALRAEPDAVDAWRFEALLTGSADLLAAGDADRALARLDVALGCWRGPAYAEYADQAWARAEIDRLDDLRALAVQRRAEALLRLDRTAEAVSDLRAHADAHPLREDAWRLLASALYRAGRQGEALAALRQARQTLVDQLGLDPGPGLRQLEADILAQAPHLLDPPAPATPAAAPAAPAATGPVAAGPPASAPGPPAAAPDGVVAAPAATGAPRPDRVREAEPKPFVGRDDELARLESAAQAAVRHGRPVLALIAGDPGVGKTALAEALTRRLGTRGWSTAWGRSPEHEGAPAALPWLQILDAEAAALAGDDPAVARFRLRRAVVSHLTALADRGPLLLVVDDLHRADDPTLDILAALVTEARGADRRPATPLLLVGTYRATETGAALTAALARVARTEPTRVHLGGLSETATGELAGSIAPAVLDAAAATLIHRRTGGNPFFVRELARLLEAEGEAALRQVPAGVRDVIRHRMARLPEPARAVLRQAAVIGRDIDPDVLVALVGDESTVLDALDCGLRTGFLTEQAPTGRPRFTHLLVRDTLYDDLSALRRARWHAAVAEAIERLRPDDSAALAHHFAYAGDPATAARAARYARLAAEQAERRSDSRQAARLWQLAIDADERAGVGPVADRLAAIMGLGRALAVTGRLAAARRHRAEAVAIAGKLDDPLLAADVIAAFQVPANWLRNDDEELSRQVVEAAERTLPLLGEDQSTRRARLLSTIALELRGTTTDRGRRAAAEAVAIARRSADPALLAFALNARFMHAVERTGLADERARIGAELVDLAARHELVTFEVLGQLILMQARCARGELAAADAHAAAADRLADRYELPVVGIFTDWYAALRSAIDGRLAEAAAGYRAAYPRLAAAGMPGLTDGLLPLALLSLRLLAGQPPDLPAPGRPAPERPGPDQAGPDRAGSEWDWGPYEPWVRPLLLLDAGDRDGAAAALADLPESPHDLLWEVRLVLAGRAAIALGDRATMASVHADLLPAAGELAGAGSGLITLGPVARYLADLAAALTPGSRPGT
ncbi:BTAD domain-containing putative transcriptional regulator [Solwaraspora sp. WMMD1047]|uniref:BTAD domain-containing putative transcriptional regulator n=1 Tax=Solwaraspora sp. WMMD1047 TaxID=3016102 RepID=UPI002415AEDB|nr:BTAD domain-containing putative transcriptional regulator [Solwaraspora sp. WMMD1047]MDG4832565.1 BTAD domain-containing putative transcriptional regulator [Solwaraspora sp. WMMD1047]